MGSDIWEKWVAVRENKTSSVLNLEARSRLLAPGRLISFAGWLPTWLPTWLPAWLPTLALVASLTA